MNLQYRIKVEVKNNGEKQYIPQVGTPRLTFGKRSVYPWVDWKNLIPQYDTTTIIEPEHMSVTGYEYKIKSVGVEETMTAIFNTETEADEVIDFYKEEMKRQEDNKLKSVYFINK